MVSSSIFALGIATAFFGANASAAHADTSDMVAAETLFRSGKVLLAQKDYEHACPKLAESYRLDPATGTLLALAICHERQGKLASAWGEYTDVASRSKTESRADREAAARAKVAELEAEVSTITIVLSDDTPTPGLVIRRNGAFIAPVWLGTPAPMDGGTVSIDVTAPGKKARHLEVNLGPVGDRQTVTLSPLVDLPVTSEPAPLAVPPAPFETAPKPEATSESPDAPPPTELVHASRNRGLSGLQVTGLVASICGVASLGVGTFFALRANDKNSSSGDECQGDLCTAAGKEMRTEAVRDGNIATGTIIGGGIAITAGLALLLFGHGSREAELADSGHTSLRFLPTGNQHGIGGVVQGSF